MTDDSNPRLFMPPSLSVRASETSQGAYALWMVSSRGHRYDELVRDGMTEVYALGLLGRFTAIMKACDSYTSEELFDCVAGQHGEERAREWLGER